MALGLTALGMPNAISVVALAERGALYSAPPGIFYMEKIAVGAGGGRRDRYPQERR